MSTIAKGYRFEKGQDWDKIQYGFKKLKLFKEEGYVQHTIEINDDFIQVTLFPVGAEVFDTGKNRRESIPMNTPQQSMSNSVKKKFQELEDRLEYELHQGKQATRRLHDMIKELDNKNKPDSKKQY